MLFYNFYHHVTNIKFFKYEDNANHTYNVCVYTHTHTYI